MSRHAVAELYDHAAESYDRYRALWLRLAGAPAEEAMLTDLRELLRPGVRVLDAGCGTGALARRAWQLQPDIELTLLDISPIMLAHARDVPGRHMLGSVLALPFDDDSFDLVVSAWVIETVAEPVRAVSEFLRVLAPAGRVLYTFCSLPDGFVSRAGSAWLRREVQRNFAGEFLSAERTPWHDCEHSHRRRFAGGLVTEVSLAKCCPVGTAALPDSVVFRREVGGGARTEAPAP